MKHLFLLAALSVSASAFSQICEVDMVDRYNRVVRTFRAYGEANSCQEGMKECRKTIRMNPYLGGVDCIRAGGTTSGPTNPGPGPGYSTDATRYLNQGESVIYNNNSYTVVGSAYNGSLALRSVYSGNIIQNVRREQVAVTNGCNGQSCVGDSVININSNASSTVVGLTYDGGFVLRSVYSGNFSTVNYNAVAVTKGCSQDAYSRVCVGNQVLDQNNTYYTVVAIQADGRVVLKSVYSGNLYTNINPRNLIVTR